MKYFTVSVPGREDAVLSTKTQVKLYLEKLEALDQVITQVIIHRIWVYRGETVECQEFSPQEFIKTRARALYAGATMNWEVSRNRGKS